MKLRSGRNKVQVGLLLLPGVAIFAIFTIYPIVKLFLMSFLKWDYSSMAVVKGDALVPEISAASIIAKVTRDHEMLELDRLHPEYGFAKHKGYPTKDHLAAIQKYGLIAGYRRSFGPVKKLLLEN